MKPTRWLGLGSADRSAHAAGARAADEALARDDAKLVIVFCSGLHDVTAVVRDVRSRTRDVPLIGCTTAGEIATMGPTDAGVVVVALGGDGFAVETAVATDASRGMRQAGAGIAR